MTQTATAPTVESDRMRKLPLWKRLAARPEIGAAIAAIVVFSFFAIQSPVFRSPDGIANWLYPASTLGIMAVAISMLMIGGEFDLSAGVMTGTAGLVTAVVAVRFEMNIILGLAVSLLVAILIGTINGLLVVKGKLPSLIATLATFLLLQGINLGGIKLLTDTTQISGLSRAGGYDIVQSLLGSTVTIGDAEFPISIFWWIGITAVATIVLMKTPFGNWVFAVGGDKVAARNTGVPVARTKMALFLYTSCSAWFVGNLVTVKLDAVQATTGIGVELIYVVAAVIGGTLLTGGFGSAVGAAIGALIFGMAQVGIIYLGWDSDWFKAFLGAMLLLAVATNSFVRRSALGGGGR